MDELNGFVDLTAGSGDPGRPGDIRTEGSAFGAALVTGHNNTITIVYGRAEDAAGAGPKQSGSEARRQVRIFLSCPGDVAYERNRVLEVATELLAESSLQNRAMLDIASWDSPVMPVPLLADQTAQEAVSRKKLKPSECDIVIVVLWSRLDAALFDECRKPDDRIYISRTEWDYEDAFKATPRPDILVYRRTEKVLLDADDPDLQTKQAQREQVKQFFSRIQSVDASSQLNVKDYGTPSAFEERLKDDLRDLIKTILKRPSRASNSGAGIPSGTLMVQPWTGSPYPGLRSFASEEAGIFFGRGREVDALVARLREPARHFLTVVGASGTGKSSLVRAGLLPQLAGGAIEDSRYWPVLAFTPGASGGDPFLALASELKGMLPARAQRPQIEIAEALASGRRRFPTYIDTLLADRPAGAALVLFVDQLEELFSPKAEKHRLGFVELLAQAAADPRLRVLATLRADFLPQCVAEATLAPLLQAGTFVLAPPGPTALADLIRRPAERAGLVLKEGLVDELLRDAGGEPGEALPLMAFCLEELYRRSVFGPGHLLTLDAYRAVGGLRGAIGRRAGELLEEIKAAEGIDPDTALPQIFRALVHVDAVGKATRQQVSRNAFMIAPAPVPQLVEALIKGRLLLAGGTDSHPIVTLTHEALIQEWPVLHEWLERGRTQMRRVQRQLLHLAAPETEDRRRAVEALGEIGPVSPEVVPALLNALGDTAEDVRAATAKALGSIGPVSPEVVPALLNALGDAAEDVRAATAKALGEIGPAVTEAVPKLLAALDDAEMDVRWAAAQALGNIGPAAAEAVPRLLVALSASQSESRTWAATALAGIGPSVPGVMPALISALGDAEMDVRAVTAEAIGNIGPAAVEAVPALITALGDAEAYVRGGAAAAFGRIGPAATEAVPALLATLGDADAGVRRATAEALGNIGPAAAKAVLTLSTALRDNEWTVRLATAETLGRIGPAAAGAVPALITALNAPELYIRAATAETLGRIGPAAAEAVPALITALGDADRGVRAVAAKALGEIGPAAAEAVPALMATLGDAEEVVRAAAATALGRIGPAAAEAVPALITALGDADRGVRGGAAMALGRVGPVTPEIVPALLATLGDAEAYVRGGAAMALGWVGPVTPEIVPALLAALGDAEAEARGDAASALGSIGPVTPEIVPALLAALGDAEAYVRRGAARALGEIGPAAAEAVPALLATLGDADRGVRAAAATALDQIGPAAT